MKKKKIIVPDTNISLGDSNCLYVFNEHDMTFGLPVIVELDRFKKGFETKNVNARRFLRELDRFPKEALFNGGASLGQGRGNVRIMLKPKYDKHIWRHLPEDTVDNQLINLCYVLQKQNPERQVEFVTRDVNLRLKAGALGIHAQDYKTDVVTQEDASYTGMRTVMDASIKLIDDLHSKKELSCPKKFLKDNSPIANEFFILKNGRKTALVSYHGEKLTLVKKETFQPSGIVPKNAEQGFALSACLDSAISLVTLGGPAGTGKTLMALASALEIIKRDNKDNMSLIFTRVNVPLGPDLGMLPGDLDEKFAPFAGPLSDNLGVLREISTGQASQIKSLENSRRIQSIPMNYIRGRSIRNAVMIIDEAQNLTQHEVKTIVTRAGDNTKIILTGDKRQIDAPYLDEYSNGLVHTIERAKGRSNYAHVELVKSERSALAQMANEIFS